MKNDCTNQVRRQLYELNMIYEGHAKNEDGEPVSLYDWICDALDIEYILDSNRALIGAHIYVTLGGPTVWVDTRRNSIECRWGTESDSRWLPCEIVDEINDILSELWV